MNQLEIKKALEIKTFMLCNLDVANDIVLSCFFLFFWFIDFLIPTVVTQIFNHIVELVISIGSPTKEAKAEKEL